MKPSFTLPVICIASLCCACSSEESDNPEKIEMVYALPLSCDIGGVSAQAQDWEYAILLAQKEINDAGGILGTELSIDVRDSGYDVEKNAAIVNEVLQKGFVPILLNGDGSLAAAGALTAALERNALLLASVAGGSNLVEQDTADLCFQLPAPSKAHGDATGVLAAQDGRRKAAVIHSDSPSNNDAADGFVAAFTQAGGEVVFQRTIPQVLPEAPYDGYADDLAAAFETGPDSLFLSTPVSPGDQFLKTWDMDRGGFAGQWYLDPMMYGQTLIDNVGQIANGMRGVVAGDLDAVNSLKQRVESASGAPVENISRLGEVYDSVYVAALAVVQAGSMDVTALRDALRNVTNPPGQVVRPGEFRKARELIAAGEDIDYEGMSGSINFDAIGLVRGPLNCWEIRDGSFVIIGSTPQVTQ